MNNWQGIFKQCIILNFFLGSFLNRNKEMKLNTETYNVLFPDYALYLIDITSWKILEVLGDF